MIRLIAAALTIFLMAPVAVSAQEIDVLPPTYVLEGDWVLQPPSITPSDPSAITQLVKGVYLGPKGSRVTVLFARVHEGAAAIRTSWDLINADFDKARGTFEGEFGIEDDLAEIPVVVGCAEMRRTSGVDRAIPDIAVGVSLCAADPDVLVLVYVSGEVNGFSGHQVSDAVVTQVLNQAAEATPTTS